MTSSTWLLQPITEHHGWEPPAFHTMVPAAYGSHGASLGSFPDSLVLPTFPFSKVSIPPHPSVHRSILPADVLLLRARLFSRSLVVPSEELGLFPSLRETRFQIPWSDTVMPCSRPFSPDRGHVLPSRRLSETITQMSTIAEDCDIVTCQRPFAPVEQFSLMAGPLMIQSSYVFILLQCSRAGCYLGTLNIPLGRIVTNRSHQVLGQIQTGSVFRLGGSVPRFKCKHLESHY